MNKYRIKVREYKESEELNTYEVEAYSEDEAIDLIYADSSGYPLIDHQLIYEDLKDEIEVEECTLIQKMV